MRGHGLLTILLIAAACRTRIPAERDREVYGGLGISALPHAGGMATGGQYFSTRHPKFDFAFELRGSLQGGDDSATRSGRFFQAQAGVKQVASPGHSSHLVFR